MHTHAPALTSGFLEVFWSRGVNSTLESNRVSDFPDPDTKYSSLIENPARGPRLGLFCVCLTLISALDIRGLWLALVVV